MGRGRVLAQVLPPHFPTLDLALTRLARRAGTMVHRKGVALAAFIALLLLALAARADEVHGNVGASHGAERVCREGVRIAGELALHACTPLAARDPLAHERSQVPR